MRSRLLAIIILFFFIVVPGTAYWYFFYANTSSITFQSTEKGITFDVSLEGKLEYTYLPLADKALVFHQICQDICTVIVPPAKYTFSLTASGKENISEDITMALGQKQDYVADFINMFFYIPVVEEDIDITSEFSLLENARASFSGEFQSIGTGKGGKYFALRTLGNTSEIGIITTDGFISISLLPFQPKTISMDISRRYIILKRGSSDQYILSLDGRESTIFPYDDVVELVDNENLWKIRTKNGVYSFEHGDWQKNPRFTDYIDISPSLRMGYIAASDTEKIALQNLKKDTSYIISLDRDTGISKVLKTEMNIQGFLFHEGKPAFFDEGGHMNEIQLQD